MARLTPNPVHPPSPAPPITRVPVPGAVRIVELVDSRRWTLGAEPRLEMTFQATGSADDRVIRTAVLNYFGPFYEGLSLISIDLTPEGIDTVKNMGRWRVEVVYQSTRENEPDQTFDTSGGSVHITQSLRTVAAVAASGSPANFNGAIGVDEKQVQGVDIVAPTYRFSEAYILDRSFVTGGYKGRLFELTGKVNDDSFRGFSKGEVLFLGASGSRVSAEKMRIDFRFASSPNLTDIAVGEVIVIEEKAGWDYMWVRYTESEDTLAKAIIRKPQAAYVEEVYRRGNFAQLGIGTGLDPLVP